MLPGFLLHPTFKPGRRPQTRLPSVEQPDEVKRRVGLVSASAGLYPYLSVREMLLFFAGSPAASRPEYADKELIGLGQDTWA